MELTFLTGTHTHTHTPTHTYTTCKYVALRVLMCFEGNRNLDKRGTADAWEHFDSRVVSLMRHLSRRFSFEIQSNVSGRANEKYKSP